MRLIDLDALTKEMCGSPCDEDHCSRYYRCYEPMREAKIEMEADTDADGSELSLADFIRLLHDLEDNEADKYADGMMEIYEMMKDEDGGFVPGFNKRNKNRKKNRSRVK